MEDFLDVFNTLSKKLLKEETDNPVAIPIEPNRLLEKLDLNLNAEGMERENFLSLIENILKAAPKTSSSKFFNQLFGGRNPEAILGELLSVMFNNSMYTYKVAGPMIGIEKVIIKEVCKTIGYPDTADGTFASGGSMTNFMSMLMARDYADPNSRKKGVTSNLIVYTSDVSHYSILKNTIFAGLGSENIRKIKTNERGEMIPSELESQIVTDVSEGHIPCMVNGTAGTTVLGVFDPISEIADICKKHNVWFHLDGALGGSVIFSKKYKHLIEGIEKTDSFSFNAHKMLGTPLTCSIIVTKNKKQLYESFSTDATYLYQTNQDEYNPGKISLQCGRRNDALKFWFLWKSVGTKGLEKMVDHEIFLADVARDYINKHPDYTLYSYDNSISVCFNYKKLAAPDLCTALYEKASLMVGHGSHRDDTFIRLVTINAANSKETILDFFADLEKFVDENLS